MSQLTVTSEGISLPAIAADTTGYMGTPLMLDNDGYVRQAGIISLPTVAADASGYNGSPLVLDSDGNVRQAPSTYTITDADVEAGYAVFAPGSTTLVIASDLTGTFSVNLPDVGQQTPMLRIVIADITFYDGAHIQVFPCEGVNFVTSSPVIFNDGILPLWEPNTVHTFYLGHDRDDSGKQTWVYVAPAISQANTPTYIVSPDEWTAGTCNLSLEYRSITIPPTYGMPGDDGIFTIQLPTTYYFTPGQQRITLFGNTWLSDYYGGITIYLTCASGESLNGTVDGTVTVADITRNTTCYPRSSDVYGTVLDGLVDGVLTSPEPTEVIPLPE